MARTISEIYDSILVAKDAEPELDVLDSSSKVAIWRLWAYITAVAMWTLENLFDLHKAEIARMIDETRPAYIKWYVQMAKDFQYGHDLVPDEIYYDNDGIDESVVEGSKVVKYAAAIGVLKGVRIKVATESDGDLAPLPLPEFEAFKMYMSRVKPAGINLSFKNQPADGLQLSLKIFYNPLVLKANGARIDGNADNPVKDAIDAFLKAQPFNGLFVVMRLVDALQKVEGVVIPHVVSVAAKYADVDWLPFEVSYQPDAGYLRVLDDNDLTIEFVAHEPI